MVKLRLKRMGSKYNAFYRIVAADVRSPRDGKFIEELGYYNPATKEVKINVELKKKWLSQGAIPTTTVKQLFAKAAKLDATGEKVKIVTKATKKNSRKKKEATKSTSVPQDKKE